jgi:hypothetical protein
VRISGHAAALAATASLGLAAAATTYVGLVTGRLSVDLGIGRRLQPLGPLGIDILAAPELVFEVAAAPYSERRPRSLQAKVEILERTDHMVLAAHRTRVGGGLTAVTVETVTLEPSRRIGFRLLRGPVPYVVESFTFDQTATGTRLGYEGELGTDLGLIGERLGRVVASTWVATVQRSLDDIRTEAERRAGPR